MVVLAAHLTLVTIISFLFFYTTSISSLRNAWQTVAQLQTYPASKYLTRASLAEDSEVEQWIKDDGYGNHFADIQKSTSSEMMEIKTSRR